MSLLRCSETLASAGRRHRFVRTCCVVGHVVSQRQSINRLRTQSGRMGDSRRVFSVFTSSPFSSQLWNRKNWKADPNIQQFLSEATLSEKEKWLESLLQSTQTNTSHDSVYQSSSSSTPFAADVHAFEAVLESMASPNASRDDPGVPRRAESLMSRLQSLYVHTDYRPELQPSVRCYQYVIQAWANTHKEEPLVIVNRSERWLKAMLEQCSDEDRDLLLPVISPDQSQEQGQQLDKNNNNSSSNDRQFHNPPLLPTIECFNAFLDGCTRGRPGRNKKKQRIITDNARKAEAILRRLISYAHHHQDQATVVCNTETCNFVIRGWSRCKHDDTIHTRVLSIIRLMEAYQRANPRDACVKPDTKSYSMALDALVSVAKMKARNFANSDQPRRDSSHDDPSRVETIESDRENAAKNGTDEMKEAHEILQYMHKLYDAGVEGVIPNRVPYNILITGWAGLAPFLQHVDPINGESASVAADGPQFKAEEILRTMITHRDSGFVEAAPDVISYEKVIMAWANSGHPNAGRRSMWWLSRLWDEYHRHREQANAGTTKSIDINLQPSAATYNAVLKALAWTEGAQHAEDLLLDLGEKFQKERTPELCPNSESFSIVIRAWTKSAEDTVNMEDRVAALKRSIEWLSSLREIENEKNLSTAPELYVGILRVCRLAAHPDRPYVLEMAQGIFDSFKESRHRLHYHSYAALLQVGLQVYRRPECSLQRSEFVKTLFLECCEEGLLSNLFVRALSNDMSPECKDLIEELRQRWPPSPSWSRNLQNDLTRVTPSDISYALRKGQESKKRQNRLSGTVSQVRTGLPA